MLNKEPYSVLTKRDSVRLLGLDTLFSENDLDTIFKQNGVIKNYMLNPEYLNVNITIIPTDSLLRFVNDTTDFWDCYYNKYGRYGYAIIAPPLFSLDRKTAIVKYSCQFHGLNGEFHTHIYKKEGNKWKVIYILYDAIS